MRNVAPPLLLACFTCLAYAGNAPSIAVFTHFDTEPSQESVSQMKSEVAAILAPSGLSLDWRNLTGSMDHETFPDLVVVKFRGSCQVRNPAMDSELGPAISGIALATTAVEDGHVIPFSDVRCDEIRRFLASDLASANVAVREAMYGKALGRVVAHELYHIFASTQTHAKDGVAREAHSRKELTEREFRFSRKETAALHERKWRALLASEAATVSWQ